MEHPQAIEAAVVAYLGAITPSPWAEDLTNDSGDLRIYAGANHLDKDGTRIVCYCDGELTEQPPFSGNRFADVVVELKTPVQEDGGASLTLHETNADALKDALMADDLQTQLNAVGGIYFYQIIERNTYREQDENAWTSGFRLRTYSFMTTT